MLYADTSKTKGRPSSALSCRSTQRRACPTQLLRITSTPPLVISEARILITLYCILYWARGGVCFQRSLKGFENSLNISHTFDSQDRRSRGVSGRRGRAWLEDSADNILRGNGRCSFFFLQLSRHFLDKQDASLSSNCFTKWDTNQTRLLHPAVMCWDPSSSCVTSK